MFGAPFGFELKVSADAPDLVRMLKFDCPWCILNSELKVSALPSGGCYLSFPPWRGLIYRTFKFDCPWCMGDQSFSECPGPGSYAQVRLPMVYVNAMICLTRKKKRGMAQTSIPMDIRRFVRTFVRTFDRTPARLHTRKTKFGNI